MPRVTPTDRRLKVAVVQRHQVVRVGLQEMLKGLAQVELVAIAKAPEELARLSFSCDVIIADSDIDPVDAESLLAIGSGKTQLVILLRSTEPGHLASATSLPANGYLLEQDLSAEELSVVLDRVARQETSVPPIMAGHLLSHLRIGSVATRAPLLTPRELDVLRHLVEGLTNKEIARELRMTVYTVKRHVANVLAKLNCPNRTMAATRATREGLVIRSEATLEESVSR